MGNKNKLWKRQQATNTAVQDGDLAGLGSVTPAPVDNGATVLEQVEQAVVETPAVAVVATPKVKKMTVNHAIFYLASTGVKDRDDLQKQVAVFMADYGIFKTARGREISDAMIRNSISTIIWDILNLGAKAYKGLYEVVEDDTQLIIRRK